MDNSEIKSCYRGYLQSAFTAQKYYNSEQISCFLKNFDKTCETNEFETAFALTLEAYGSEDVPKACRTVADYIERQMSKYSQTHKGIPTQGRLAALIKRYNRNISTLAGISVTLGDKCLTLTDEELENCKINNMNHCLKAAETHTATASTKNNPKNRGCDKLVVEVKYF